MTLCRKRPSLGPPPPHVSAHSPHQLQHGSAAVGARHMIHAPQLLRRPLLLYSRFASMLQPAPAPACVAFVAGGRQLPPAATLLRARHGGAAASMQLAPARRAEAVSALTSGTFWQMRRTWSSVAPVRAVAEALDAAEAAGGAKADSAGAPSAGLDGSWGGFLEQLWERGYFQDRTSADLQAAAGSKRDVKKALQQLGRQRPDILPQLPQPLVVRLAAAKLEPAALSERKTANAFARIQAAAAAPGGVLGRASTQDVLRVLWAVCSSSSSSSSPVDGEQDNTVAVAAADELLQQVLQLEQQPPNQELLAAAAAAADTPDAAKQQQQQERKQQRKEQQQQQQQQQREQPAVAAGAGKVRGKASGASSGGAGGAEAAPAGEHVAEHKARLLRAAPFRQLRAGDWFCGQCSVHNFASNPSCVRCGVPNGSLGNSRVTRIDLVQLQQVGLGAVPFSQRKAAAEYAEQLLGGLQQGMSLPAALKQAGLAPFDGAARAAEEEQRGGGSSSDDADDDGGGGGRWRGSEASRQGGRGRGRGAAGSAPSGGRGQRQRRTPAQLEEQRQQRQQHSDSEERRRRWPAAAPAAAGGGSAGSDSDAAGSSLASSVADAFSAALGDVQLAGRQPRPQQLLFDAAGTSSADDGSPGLRQAQQQQQQDEEGQRSGLRMRRARAERPSDVAASGRGSEAGGRRGGGSSSSRGRGGERAGSARQAYRDADGGRYGGRGGGGSAAGDDGEDLSGWADEFGDGYGGGSSSRGGGGGRWDERETGRLRSRGSGTGSGRGGSRGGGAGGRGGGGGGRGGGSGGAASWTDIFRE